MEEEAKQRLEVDQWQKNLSRVIRRARIHQEGRRIKTDTFKFNDVVVRDLVDKEVSIEPRMAEVGSYIYSLISQEFPDVQGVVLLGSLVHGGAQIRNATGTGKGPDLDWGVITSRPLTFREGGLITRVVDNHREEMVNKFKLPKDFYPCLDANPSHFRTIAVQNVDQMTDFLLDKEPLDDVNPPDDRLRKELNAVMFLLPSFPPEANEKNRQLLLESLRKIAGSDKKRWQEIVKGILNEWKRYHSLSERHFYQTGLPKDTSLIKGIVSQSASAMSGPIQDLLEATGGEQVSLESSGGLEEFKFKGIEYYSQKESLTLKQREILNLAAQMKERLKRSWSAESSAQPYDWSQEHPEIGQCGSTTLLFQDYFGGDIAKLVLAFVPRDKDAIGGSFGQHFTNLVEGLEVDLTGDQYNYTHQGDIIYVGQRKIYFAQEMKDISMASENAWRQYLTLRKKFEKENQDFLEALRGFNS